jgi:hypothetical protein
MKYLLFLLLTLTINSCDKNDDDNGPQDPISQLPPATQVGANTFGALLDGEPFIPNGGVSETQCNYQLLNNERYFFVTGIKRESETFNLFSLSLYKCQGDYRRLKL